MCVCKYQQQAGIRVWQFSEDVDYSLSFSLDSQLRGESVTWTEFKTLHYSTLHAHACMHPPTHTPTGKLLLDCWLCSRISWGDLRLQVETKKLRVSLIILLSITKPPWHLIIVRLFIPQCQVSIFIYCSLAMYQLWEETLHLFAKANFSISMAQDQPTTHTVHWFC